MPAHPTVRVSTQARSVTMQDLLWIGALVGLLAATLAYVRLCDLA